MFVKVMIEYTLTQHLMGWLAILGFFFVSSYWFIEFTRVIFDHFIRKTKEE